MSINWNDMNSQLSKYFKVGETLLLPSFGIHHSPTDEEKTGILKQAQLMDAVRDILGHPITVDCWLRPVSVRGIENSSHDGVNYNALKGGATHSQHMVGKATDFWCPGFGTPDEVRAALEPHLEVLQARMERKDGSSWIHIDCGDLPAGGHRYFIP